MLVTGFNKFVNETVDFLNIKEFNENKFIDGIVLPFHNFMQNFPFVSLTREFAKINMKNLLAGKQTVYHKLQKTEELYFAYVDTFFKKLETDIEVVFPQSELSFGEYINEIVTTQNISVKQNAVNYCNVIFNWLKTGYYVENNIKKLF